MDVIDIKGKKKKKKKESHFKFGEKVSKGYRVPQ
jgi:hypothetical protein